MALSKEKLSHFIFSTKGKDLLNLVCLQSSKHMKTIIQQQFLKIYERKDFVKTGKPTKYLHCLTSPFTQSKEETNQLQNYYSLLSQWYLEKEE